MNIFGIGLQELAMIIVTAAVVVFHIRMVMDAWNGNLGILFKLIWVAVILAMPFVGAFLYWWFVKRTNTVRAS